MSNAKRPHVATLFIKIEVFSKLDTGECSGTPINLSEHDIESVQLVHVEGFDRFDVLKKLKERLNNLKNG